jgi:hypothetical protein
VDRLCLSAKKPSSRKNKNLATNAHRSKDTDDELEATLEHICRDIGKDLDDVGSDQILCDLNAVPRKKKNSSHKDKGTVPHLPKKPITPSKIVSQSRFFFGIVEVLGT